MDIRCPKMIMNILEHLDKNNLHHAYLIEGVSEEIIPELFKFVESMGIKVSGNPDFYNISIDTFKVEDARNLKSVEHEKGFSTDKKIYIISANNFLLEAQNTLLKIFEEPIEGTHFFLVVPDKNALLRTLVSRFYVISARVDLAEKKNEFKEDAEKFIEMLLGNRISFIKELLTEPEEEEEEEVLQLDSNRSKALKFLNSLETTLVSKAAFDTKVDFFGHIFKVREFINQPGSSVKTLMESVALMMPRF